MAKRKVKRINSTKRTATPRTTKKKTPPSRAKAVRAKKPKPASNQAEPATSDAPTMRTKVLLFVRRIPAEKPLPPLVETIVTADEAAAEFSLRRRELLRQRKAADDVVEKYAPLFSSDEWTKKYGKIASYNVELRKKFGRHVSPLTYVIWVRFENKLNERELKDAGRIGFLPDLDGIPVKIGECHGELSADPDLPTNPLPLDQDVVGGVPCAPKTTPTIWGTLGVAVSPDEKKFFGLTNHHVLPTVAKQAVQLGPAVGDVSTTAPLGPVKGSFLGKATFPYGSFSIDCASIDLTGVVGRKISKSIRGWKPEWGTKIWFPAAKKYADSDDTLGRVYVFGAKTGLLLEGRLEDPRFNFFPVGGIVFSNIIKITRDTRFIQGGDSGSLLLLEIEKDQQRGVLAVGLVFARDKTEKTIGYACHMRPILDQLQLQIPTADLLKSWVTPHV